MSAGWPERGDEKAEGRNRPEDGQHDRQAGCPRRGQLGLGVLQPKLLLQLPRGRLFLGRCIRGDRQLNCRTGHAHRISSESRICRTL